MSKLFYLTRISFLVKLPLLYRQYIERYRDPRTGKNRTVCVTYDKDTARNRKEAALNARYIRECMSDMKPVTYNEKIKRLKTCLRWAYRNDYLADISWIEKLQPVKDDKKSRIAEKYLEREELKKLLAGMKVEKWRLFTIFLTLTGLRIGEAIALEDEDVDLASRQIHITKTYLCADQRLQHEGKTSNSYRSISIQNELVPIIKSMRACIRRERLIYRAPSTLFYPDAEGGYLHYATYCKYLKTNSEKILHRTLTPHALRHTMVSLMAGEDVSLETISRRCGHADSRITKEIYFHVTQKLQERDAEEIKDIRIC